MTYLYSIILGIVEGITEFLPISSTAHLEIVSRLLGIIQTDFAKSFVIIIQLGAILAVVVLYAGRVRGNLEIWKRVIVAFIPTGIIGFLLYKVVKHYFLGNFKLMTFALLLGGIALIIFELVHREPAVIRESTEASLRELESLSYPKAIAIGTVQALAVIPGVSRSAATVVAGMSLGVRRAAIVEFSFLLAIPTMVAASGYDIYKNASAFSSSQVGVLAVGFIVSFLTALVAIKVFLNYIQKHSFIVFGAYRIVLAVILFATMMS